MSVHIHNVVILINIIIIQELLILDGKKQKSFPTHFCFVVQT